MPMSGDDYHELARHFLDLVRERDSATFERLVEHVRFDPQRPKRSLLNFIRAYAEIGAVRSVGAHAAILDRLNHHVRTEQAGPVRGIRVTLSPTEQRLYRSEYIDLVPTLDFSEFTSALRRLYERIMVEGGPDDDEE